MAAVATITYVEPNHVNINVQRVVEFGQGRTGLAGPDAVKGVGDIGHGYLPTPFTRSTAKYLYETKVNEQLTLPDGLLMTSVVADYYEESAGEVAPDNSIALTEIAMPPSAPTGVTVVPVSGSLYRVMWQPLPRIPGLVSMLSSTIASAQYVRKLVVGVSDAVGGPIVATDMSSTSVEGDSAVVDMSGFDFTTDASKLHVSLYNTGFGEPKWGAWPDAPSAPDGVVLTKMTRNRVALTWTSPYVRDITDVSVSCEGVSLAVSDVTPSSVVVDLSGVDLESGQDRFLSVALGNCGVGPVQSSLVPVFQTSGIGLGVVAYDYVPVVGGPVKLLCTNLSRTGSTSGIGNASLAGVWERGPAISMALGGQTSLVYQPRRAGTLKFKVDATDSNVFPVEYVVEALPVKVAVTTTTAPMIGDFITVVVSVTDTRESSYAGPMGVLCSLAGSWDTSSFQLTSARPFSVGLRFTPSAGGVATFSVTSGEIDVSVSTASVTVIDPLLTVWSEAPVVAFPGPVTVCAVYKNGPAMGGSVVFAADVSGEWSASSGGFDTVHGIVTSEFTPAAPGTVTFSAVGRASQKKYVAVAQGANWSSTVLVAGTGPSFRANL